MLFCSSEPTFLDTCSRNESGILISPKRFLFSGIFLSTFRPCFALLVRSCARDNGAMLQYRARFTLKYPSPPTEAGERKPPGFHVAPVITVPTDPCPSTSMLKANWPNYKLQREGKEKTTKNQSFFLSLCCSFNIAYRRDIECHQGFEDILLLSSVCSQVDLYSKMRCCGRCLAGI